MNKKIIIILAFILGVIGFIFTGIIAENPSGSDHVNATYCSFNVEHELIQQKVDGKKYMQTPEIPLGEAEKYYLTEFISYDENATQSIYEINVVIDTNHPEMVTLGNFILTIDCTAKELPGDLKITITISTNDGSNLTDKLYIVCDPSDLPIEVNPDF